ncbi:hypothetical protein DL95DRAFT_483058 [Leptodontidium sp. 2 PMI_412]|nr:hypothetical protein DL95DRAFT_483058 [Leptodontidium sp. 2 PMI_412]
MDTKDSEIPFLPKGGINFVQNCLLVLSPSASSNELPDDWVFVSLSIKNIHALSDASKFQNGQWLDFQVGLSILDTKSFQNEAEHRAIKSYNLVGTYKPYVDKAVQEFHFGITEVMLAQNIAWIIRSIMFSYPRRNRKIALVGHGLKPYLRALQVLGLDVRNEFHACVDTHDIAQELFDCVSRLTFTELVEELDIKHPCLNNAGNYANYMMKALMALATLDWEGQLPTDQNLRPRVVMLMSIANNLVVSAHCKMFPADYRDLPEPKQKEEKVDIRDCIIEKKIRIIRRQNREWVPSWDEAVLCSRLYRWSLLENMDLSSCTRN